VSWRGRSSRRHSIAAKIRRAFGSSRKCSPSGAAPPVDRLRMRFWGNSGPSSGPGTAWLRPWDSYRGPQMRGEKRRHFRPRARTGRQAQVWARKSLTRLPHPPYSQKSDTLALISAPFPASGRGVKGDPHDGPGQPGVPQATPLALLDSMTITVLLPEAPLGALLPDGRVPHRGGRSQLGGDRAGIESADDLHAPRPSRAGSSGSRPPSASRPPPAGATDAQVD